MVVRLRPTLPHRLRCSTIGAEGLSFRVRNGTGRFPFAVTAVTLWRYLGRPHPQCLFGGGVGVRISGTAQWTRAKINIVFVWCQVVGVLVPVSCMHCCTSTSGLSTQSSTGSLSNPWFMRSEEHTSELQSRFDLVC